MKAVFIFIMTIHFINGSTGCVSGKEGAVAITWRIAGKLPAVNGSQPGVAGASSGMHNNIMLVAGGANFPDSMPWTGGKKKYHDHIYTFVKHSDGTFSSTDDDFRLPEPVAYAATASTTKGIVCAGGENDNGIRKEVFLLQWNAANKTIIHTPLPSLPFALTNAAITSSGDIVYLAGGEAGNEVSNVFLSLDLNDTAAGWQSLPSLPQRVSHAMLVNLKEATGNDIYLIGGRKKNLGDTSTLYKDVYRYDFASMKWMAATSLPYALSAASAFVVDSENIFVIGGDQGSTFHQTESVIAAIGAAKTAAEQQALMEQKAAIQSRHPGFSNRLLRYNTRSEQWSVMDDIPFTVPVTTTAFKWNDDVILASGEIRAGVRTPDILAGKIITR